MSVAKHSRNLRQEIFNFFKPLKKQEYKASNTGSHSSSSSQLLANLSQYCPSKLQKEVGKNQFDDNLRKKIVEIIKADISIQEKYQLMLSLYNELNQNRDEVNFKYSGCPNSSPGSLIEEEIINNNTKHQPLIFRNNTEENFLAISEQASGTALKNNKEGLLLYGITDDGQIIGKSQDSNYPDFYYATDEEGRTIASLNKVSEEGYVGLFDYLDHVFEGSLTLKKGKLNPKFEDRSYEGQFNAETKLVQGNIAFANGYEIDGAWQSYQPCDGQEYTIKHPSGLNFKSIWNQSKACFEGYPTSVKIDSKKKVELTLKLSLEPSIIKKDFLQAFSQASLHVSGVTVEIFEKNSEARKINLTDESKSLPINEKQLLVDIVNELIEADQFRIDSRNKKIEYGIYGGTFVAIIILGALIKAYVPENLLKKNDVNQSPNVKLNNDKDHYRYFFKTHRKLAALFDSLLGSVGVNNSDGSLNELKKIFIRGCWHKGWRSYYEVKKDKALNTSDEAELNQNLKQVADIGNSLNSNTLTMANLVISWVEDTSKLSFSKLGLNYNLVLKSLVDALRQSSEDDEEIIRAVKYVNLNISKKYSTQERLYIKDFSEDNDGNLMKIILPERIFMKTNIGQAYSLAKKATKESLIFFKKQAPEDFKKVYDFVKEEFDIYQNSENNNQLFKKQTVKPLKDFYNLASSVENRHLLEKVYKQLLCDFYEVYTDQDFNCRFVTNVHKMNFYHGNDVKTLELKRAVIADKRLYGFYSPLFLDIARRDEAYEKLEAQMFSNARNSKLDLNKQIQSLGFDLNTILSKAKQAFLNLRYDEIKDIELRINQMMLMKRNGYGIPVINMEKLIGLEAIKLSDQFSWSPERTAVALMFILTKADFYCNFGFKKQTNKIGDAVSNTPFDNLWLTNF